MYKTPTDVTHAHLNAQYADYGDKESLLAFPVVHHPKFDRIDKFDGMLENKSGKYSKEVNEPLIS
jgi:hypothetical protein